MKVSLNLIRKINAQYGCARNPYEYGVDEIIKRIGAQLGAIEEVIYTGKKYDGIVVASVVSCEKHPNADNLHVCFIDDGGVTENVTRNEQGYVQVVCGAPNVREGLTVAWLPPGSVVPATADTKEPFTLGTRELRGIMSNGMLASASELGLSDDHSGLLEIKAEEVGEENTRPGTPFKNLFELDDVVIDCENKMFTHRPDCFGTMGVAREIAGIFGEKYTSPSWYTKSPNHQFANESHKLVVENNAKELVSRFMCQLMSNVNVGPSPLWLQSYLARVGSRSINNVVDWSNYLMMLTAQPTHAFDYDKVKALSDKEEVFGPRMARENEKLTLLNGKEITLTTDDIVIAYGDTPLALAGIMGGADTEVDANTKNIIIECATFDLYAVRRTTMRHGVFSDAATRYTKGQNNLQNPIVLDYMVQNFVENNIASPEGNPIDIFDNEPAHITVTTDASFINSRLGTNIAPHEMQTLLENVEMGVIVDGENLQVNPPYWRMDIELSEDIVEEIGRLYGYDKIEVTLPLRPSKAPAKNAVREAAQKVRNILTSRGANEVYGYSFVHGDLLKKVGQNPENTYHIRNAISPELQYYRIGIVPSLLDKVFHNIKNGSGTDDNAFALYEINKVHLKGVLDESDFRLPLERTHIGFVFAADDKTARSQYGATDPYYQAAAYLDALLPGVVSALVRLDSIEIHDEWTRQICSPFEPSRSGVIVINNEAVGVVGEFRSSVKKSLKLPAYSAGFELNLRAIDVAEKKYVVKPTFPKTTADITFEINSSLTYGALLASVRSSLATIDGLYKEVSCKDIYKPEDVSKTRYTMRLTIASYDHTLTSDEANAIVENVVHSVSSACGAVRI